VQCEDFLESELPPKFGVGRPKAIRHVRSFSEGQTRRTDDIHGLGKQLVQWTMNAVGHDGGLLDEQVEHIPTPPPTADSTCSSDSAQSFPDVSLTRSDMLCPNSLMSESQDETEAADLQINQAQPDTEPSDTEPSQDSMTFNSKPPPTDPLDNSGADPSRSRFFSWSFFGSRRSPRKAPEMAAVAEVASPIAEEAEDVSDLLSASVETVSGLEDCEQEGAATEHDPIGNGSLAREPSPTIATPALKTMDIRRRLSQAASTPENQVQLHVGDVTRVHSCPCVSTVPACQRGPFCFTFQGELCSQGPYLIAPLIAPIRA
jgi:hypothetical protein